MVKFIGLAPDGGGLEKFYTWNDQNSNTVFDGGEEVGPLTTGRNNVDNHEMGIAIVIAIVLVNKVQYLILQSIFAFQFGNLFSELKRCSLHRETHGRMPFWNV